MDTKTTNEFASKLKTIMETGEGSGATATATLEATGRIASAEINAAGSGYSVDDVLTVETGTGGTFTVTEVGENGEVTAIAQVDKGTGYDSDTGAATTVSPDNGSGCTLDTTVEFGIDSIAVDEGGEDYLTADVIITGSGTGGGEATATLDTGVVDSIAVDEAGWYLATPTVTITGAPKTGANLLTHLNAYDLSTRDARIKEILEDATKVVVVDSGPVNAALAAL